MSSNFSSAALRRIIGLSLLSMAVITTPARAAFITFSTGGTAATSSIESTVDAFRTAAGVPDNGNAAGPLASGQREINWDGGGAPRPPRVTSPLTAFTNNRGATWQPALGAQGSSKRRWPTLRMTSINASYATTFNTFTQADFHADRQQRHRCHIFCSWHERSNPSHGRRLWCRLFRCRSGECYAAGVFQLLQRPNPELKRIAGHRAQRQLVVLRGGRQRRGEDFPSADHHWQLGLGPS